MAVSARKRAAAPVIESATMPAPMGGINAVTTLSQTPATDCLRLWNMIASEFGLRVRLGQREWLTGLTGLADNQVRTVIPYKGSVASGSADRLFVTTTTGIWDVSASYAAWTASTDYVIGDLVLNGTHVYICDTDGTSDTSGGPTGTGTNIADGTTQWDWVETLQLVTFGTQTGDAGRGIFHSFVTLAGHFLFYADEENGFHLYTESTDTWSKYELTGVPWAAATVYEAGDRVTNDGGKVYTCDTGGTSAGSGGPTGTGTGINDNGVIWDYTAAAPTAGLYLSLADQRLGVDFDPADLCFVTAFKGRPWMLQKDTARAWYLPAGTIAGLVTKFDLATKFKNGGDAVGLWNWTYDGGSGIDDSLVCVSRGGDVAIYKGTDPASVATFGLNGVWSIGAPPAGRRIATDNGGDLWLLSRSGIVPLSALVSSATEEAKRSQYATAKIAPLFNQLMLTQADLDGWGMYLHPEEGALVVTVPTTDGADTEQLVLSLNNRSWSRYRDLPVFSAESWQGKFYFATADGRVCVNDGYVDGRTLADPDSVSEIHWSLITSFTNLGIPNKKQIREVTPVFIADGGTPAFKVEARYDYDFTEAGTPGTALGTGSLWGTALWGTAVWGGDYATTQQRRGVSGMGIRMGLALAGSSTFKVALTEIDVRFIRSALP